MTHTEEEADEVTLGLQKAGNALSVVSMLFSLLVWPLGTWVWQTQNQVVVLEQQIVSLQKEVDENTEEARKVALIQQDISYIKEAVNDLAGNIEKALERK